jgi:hypothetical protein
MKPKDAKIVTPSPFFKIIFGCSNRAFYQVKNELWEIAEKVDIELNDGYMTEKCDYEGDLEEIIIYNCERASKFIDEVLKFYEVESYNKEEGLDLVLSIF